MRLRAGFPRSYSIIKALEELGYLITIYPNTFPHIDDLEQIYKSISHFTEVASDFGGGKFEQFLEKRKEFYDIIWVSRPHNMKTCRKSLHRYKNNYKIIYNAEAIFAEREIEQKILSHESLGAYEQNQMIENELNLCDISDTVFAVSETDADKFRVHGFEKVKVLGHTLNIQAGNYNFNQRKDILFVGNLDVDDSPNVDSIFWFVQEILPLIRKKIPQIQFHIIDSCKANSLHKLKEKGLTFHGKVNDLKTFYDNCRIFVAPTRFAAGIPYKVHEAASFGIPVVATELLVDQLGWSNNEHIISSEIDKDSFAYAVIRLYGDEVLWKKIRSNTLKIIEKEFSKNKFKQTISDALNRISDK